MSMPKRFPQSFRRHTGALAALALALIAVPGCDDEWIAAGRQASVCPEDECGVNAATANELYVGEGHLFQGQHTGRVNARGVKIVDFLPPDGSPGYILRVQNGRFVASRPGSTLTGAGLVGSTIAYLDTQSARAVEITLDAVASVPSWTETPVAVERYVFKSYDAVAGTEVPVCDEAGDLTEESAWAVVLGAERYSLTSKSVIESGPGAAGWFTITCSGNALYKMKMMGYEPLADPGATYLTTPDQRQATLKMITADYCGTGRSFTEDGTDLSWINDGGWSQTTNQNGIHEAFWNAQGARCLDIPRLGQMAEIQAECAQAGLTLGPCANFAGHYEWQSINPT